MKNQQQKEKSKWLKLNDMILNILLLLFFASIITFLIKKYLIATILLTFVFAFGFGYFVGIRIGGDLMGEFMIKGFDEWVEKFLTLLGTEIEELPEECQKKIYEIIKRTRVIK